jgi:uncharacterized delta-60 repeat protein
MMSRPRSTIAIALALGACLAATPAAAGAAAGDLDPSFGRYGKRVYSPRATLLGGAVAVQADGKTLITGTRYVSGRSSGPFVMRLERDGKPDASFAPGGILQFALPVRAFSAIQLDGQGRIVLAAALGAEPFTGPVTQGVVRLLPDGSLDPAFGSGGIDDTGVLVSSLAGGEYDLDLAPGGQIVLAGGTADGSGGTVMRRLPDGGPDPSFSADGIATVPFGNGGYLGSVALGADGSVYAAGAATLPEHVGVLLKLGPDGEPTQGFGEGGTLLVRFFDRASEIHDIAVGPAGVIVAGGGRTGEPALARFDPTSGTPDPAFSGDGFVRVPARGDRFALLSSVALLSGGKVLAAGETNGDARVLRYRVGGKPDRSFADRGEALIGVGGNLDGADELVVGPDGRITLVGERGVSGFRSNDYDLAVARLLAGGRRHDLDADGRPDRRDLCPQLPARAHRGCPFFPRRISIRFTDDGRFKGSIGSPGPDGNRRCIGGDGRVTVFERERGADPVVGSIPKTKGDGDYEIPARRAEGTFYARVQAAVDERAGLCGAARSRFLAVN